MSSYQNEESISLVSGDNEVAVASTPPKRSLGMTLAGLLCLALVSYYAGMARGQQPASLVSRNTCTADYQCIGDNFCVYGWCRSSSELRFCRGEEMCSTGKCEDGVCPFAD